MCLRLEVREKKKEEKKKKKTKEREREKQAAALGAAVCCVSADTEKTWVTSAVDVTCP